MKTGPGKPGKWEEKAAAGRSWYSPRNPGALGKKGGRKWHRENSLDIHADQGFKLEEPGKWQSHHLWQF